MRSMTRNPAFLLPLLLAAVQSAFAQVQVFAPATLPEVIVTGNPLGSDLFELAAPASVLQGEELFRRRRATLGETLDGLPGVAATGFGPNASRPVIRGLDADRVRILQNGSGVLDASSLSFDHAVSIDPLVIERAEVVRGPAALFYGGSAVGGVVNVIDNRIPQSAIRGVNGRVEARAGGAERERAVAGVVDIGNGSLALHADLYSRDTDDLKIKGFASSARLRAADPQAAEAVGTLANSASRSDGGAVGLSHTWTDGYIGISRSEFNSKYGTVAEPTVTIDMQSSRWDLAGEVRALNGPLTALKFKAGKTDYSHVEVDAGTPATRFRNKGYDMHIEAAHRRLGPLQGAFGFQVVDFDFSALGDEAFVPSTNTGSRAGFFYEEFTVGKVRISFGGRHERSEVGSAGGGEVPFGAVNPRFDTAQTRNFNANSGALGAVWSFAPGLALAVNGAYTERAPTYYELYANGPHAATGVYETGNAAFGKEKSKSLDLALRMKSGKHSGSIGVFQNRFNNFITLFNTGNNRGADGELNPPDAGDETSANTGDEILPEFAYRAVPARFRGIEGEGRFRLSEKAGILDLLLQAGYVRADDASTGRPLPRIAPWRYGASLDYRYDRMGARLDAIVVEGQDRVAAGERPTDGYTMLNASLSYRLPAPGVRLEAFMRGLNLLDEEARNHVSFLKDVAPLGRRSAQLGLRGQF